ncbi:SIS domain-containing protein [Lactobacillus sp. ESL0679]|uniref:SIS domain-containing protein n=1 Tax=Lactobacillus sp. ESL0679 TaxID=2983209 RepID=UPI0023F6BC1A|nr:SIS domain-containing protein [Lactobacillus sp. ESL0679]MDF7682780.1 SIS domain-containing protein [Lactobacillus sp. ESL0679]
MYFNKEEFINNYEKAVNEFPKVEEVALNLKALTIKKIYFTGCGGSFTKFVDLRPLMFKILKVPFIIVSPEELTDLYLNDLNENSLVVCGSNSGETEELIKALSIIKDKSPKTTIVGFVREKDTTMEKMGALKYKLNSIDTDVNLLDLGWLLEMYSDQTVSMNTSKAVSNLLAIKEKLADKIEVLLPDAVKKVNSTDLNDLQIWVSSGRAWGEVCCFSNYMSEEIQRIKSQAIHSGEYFHGPFEITDENQSINVVLNSNDTRNIDLRVVNFAKKYAKDCFIVDMKSFELNDLPENLRVFVEPYVLNHYFDALHNIYSNKTGRSSRTRRYYRLMKY